LILTADLHIHTTYSDGLLTPDEVIKVAFQKGLYAISITDHDTVAGIRKFENSQVKVIPGIEFGCVFEGEDVHILGYFSKYFLPKISEKVSFLKEKRTERCSEIIKKLNNQGLKIDMEDVCIYTQNGLIGRPHIARALIERGYVHSMREAFDLYLNRGCPAYVERCSLSIEETIDLIHEEGGIAVLAHPGLIKRKEIIDYVIKEGIDGLEVIHSKHTHEDVVYFLSLAKKKNLLITGGSDSHGDLINGEYLIGRYYVPVDNLMKGERRISIDQL
jgi:hypothetical protein